MNEFTGSLLFGAIVILITCGALLLDSKYKNDAEIAAYQAGLQKCDKNKFLKVCP